MPHTQHNGLWREARAAIGAGFITPGDELWRRMLATVRHDFYHLPEYVELCARQEGGTATAFYAETPDNALLIPLLARDIPVVAGEWKDLSSPYGYPSPLLRNPADGDGLHRFMEEFRWLAAHQGYVSLFLRLHPLLPLPTAPLRDFGELVIHGETVSIDLTQPEQLLWRQIRRDQRAGIRRLRERGFRVEMDDWSTLDEFMRIYSETMRRVGARGFYLFQKDYFTGLRSALGDRLHICQVISPHGHVAAGGLFSLTHGIMQLHLSGTSDAYQKMGPSKLMLYEICRWGQKAGARTLHLGGGVRGREDSLFGFKAAFSPLRNSFATFRMVVMEERYREIVRIWKKNRGHIGPDDDYFPPYRYIE